MTSEEYRFIEAIRDTYMHQHVLEPTRGRDNPTLLDLIFTNEEGIIERIEHKSPLGKSDHGTSTTTAIQRGRDPPEEDFSMIKGTTPR